MRETGVVQAVEDGKVLVRFKRHAACLGCRACSLSSSGDMIVKAIVSDKVNPVRDNKDTTSGIKISNGMKIGDKVTIEIDSASIIKAIVLAYLLPAVAFLVGVFAGLRIAPLLGFYKHKEVISILIGGVLLGASLFLARSYGMRKRDAYQARIIRRDYD